MIKGEEMIRPNKNIFNKGFYLCRGSDALPLRSHEMPRKIVRKNQGGFLPLLIIGLGILIAAVLILWLLGGSGNCLDAAQYYKNEIENCWSCNLYNVVFNAINGVATKAYDGLHNACLGLLAVCLALWILFFTGRYLFSFAERRPEEYLTKLLQMFFKTTVVAALLSFSASTFSTYIVSPVVTTATEYGIAVMEGFYSIRGEAVRAGDGKDESNDFVKCENGTCTYKDVNCATHCEYNFPFDFSCKYGCEFRDYKTITPKACDRMKNHDYSKDNDKNLITAEIKDSFMCMINSMHYEAAYVTAMANAMLCHSWTAEEFMNIRLPSITMLVTSVLILLAVLVITIVYVFKLVDIVLRLGMLLILMPVLAVAFVFPVTLDFAKKGFGLLVHIAVAFVTLILVLSISLLLVSLAFSGGGESKTLMDYFNRNDINNMKDVLDFSSVNFFFGLITLLIAIKILSISEHIATEFSHIQIGTSIGDRLGAAMSSITVMTSQMGLRTAKLFSTGAFNSWREGKLQKKMDAIRNHENTGRKAAKAAKFEGEALNKKKAAVAATERAENLAAESKSASNRAEFISKQKEYVENRVKQADKDVDIAKKARDSAQKDLAILEEKENEVKVARVEFEKSLKGGETEENRKVINEKYAKLQQAEKERNEAKELLKDAQGKFDKADKDLKAAEEARSKVRETQAKFNNMEIDAKTIEDLAKIDADKAAAKADKLTRKYDDAAEKAEKARLNARTFTEKLADYREEKAEKAREQAEASEKKAGALWEEKKQTEERFSKHDDYVKDSLEQVDNRLAEAQMADDLARSNLDKVQDKYGQVGTVEENEEKVKTARAEFEKSLEGGLTEENREVINEKYAELQQAEMKWDESKELKTAQDRAVETEKNLKEATDRRENAYEMAEKFEAKKKRDTDEASQKAEKETERYTKLQRKADKRREKAEKTRITADVFKGKY